MDMLKTFKAARGVGTPIVIIQTPDPAATEKTIVNSKPVDDKGNVVPILNWDIVRGITALNDSGKRLIGSIPKANEKRAPAEMMEVAVMLPKDTILFAQNIHMYWDNPRSKEDVRQGIWNLRDPYKANGKMFIGLTTFGAIVPPEISRDSLVVSEALPTPEELSKIIVQVCTDAREIYPKLPKPDEKVVNRAVDAVVGLSAFQAEQAGAMNIGPTGFDYNELWETKRQVVEQTRGLSVQREGTKFAQIAGCENAKKFFTDYRNGKGNYDGIVFIDEIEKHFAGTGTDLSGVSTKQAGYFLTWMESRKAKGSLFIGHPGCAKTYFASALGNEAGVPTVNLDFSAMESGIVGSSGEFLRGGLKIVEAMFKRPLFIGTCNGWGQMPTALRRRFTLPTFFFDLLTQQEREAAWAIWMKSYGLKFEDGSKAEFPKDAGWTGAEIRNCCDIAYSLGVSVKEAGSYIVPVCESDPTGITTLREEADGKFISASYEGKYKHIKTPDDPVMLASKPSRVFRAMLLEVPVPDGDESFALPKLGGKDKDKSKYDA